MREKIATKIVTKWLYKYHFLYRNCSTCFSLQETILWYTRLDKKESNQV